MWGAAVTRETLPNDRLSACPDDEQTLQMQRKLCPHQWIHYLFNQIGMLNPEQIEFEFNDALVWLRTAVVSSGRSPEGIATAKGVLAV